MGDDNWCIDLDSLCLPDDHADMVKAIQAAEEGTNTVRPNSITNRGRALSDGTVESSSKEGKKELSTSKSRERRSSGSEKEPSKKSISYGLPFNLSNLSFSSAKKDRATDASTNGDKVKNNDTATVYSEDSSNANRNNREINANVFMISGCQDSQTSADVGNVSSFSLPNPSGRAGGACTSALLKGKSNRTNHATKPSPFISPLTNLHQCTQTFSLVLQPRCRDGSDLCASARKDEENPQWRSLLADPPIDIVPENECHRSVLHCAPELSRNKARCTYWYQLHRTGEKYCVSLGLMCTTSGLCNLTLLLLILLHHDQNGELSGCHNDCLNMKDYIMNVWGFEEDNIVVLMDDGNHNSPTRENILQAYEELAELTGSGDAAFCHYSGKYAFILNRELCYFHCS